MRVFPANMAVGWFRGLAFDTKFTRFPVKKDYILVLLQANHSVHTPV